MLGLSVLHIVDCCCSYRPTSKYFFLLFSFLFGGFRNFVYLLFNPTGHFAHYDIHFAFSEELTPAEEALHSPNGLRRR